MAAGPARWRRWPETAKMTCRPSRRHGRAGGTLPRSEEVTSPRQRRTIERRETFLEDGLRSPVMKYPAVNMEMLLRSSMRWSPRA